MSSARKVPFPILPRSVTRNPGTRNVRPAAAAAPCVTKEHSVLPTTHATTGTVVLTHEQNELLTRVEGDAPMGRLIREHYWIPALLSAQLEADGAPQRERLLGEDHVAFRASDGRVGFFAEACPHRGCSLV